MDEYENDSTNVVDFHSILTKKSDQKFDVVSLSIAEEMSQFPPSTAPRRQVPSAGCQTASCGRDARTNPATGLLLSPPRISPAIFRYRRLFVGKPALRAQTKLYQHKH